MEIFKGQNIIEFVERFNTNEKCQEYLSEIKWSKAYICRKCKHTECQIRKNYSRTCNICNDTESATANTLFHKLKFGLRKAFFICFEMATTSIVGGREEGKPGRSYDSKKKKAVCAVELTEEEKVKRFYVFKIEDYSSKSLKRMFDKHIDKQAKVTTDKWKGYNPIAKDYNITQILSNKGSNFKALHTMIHQVK